jgi:hypothetical protein
MTPASLQKPPPPAIVNPVAMVSPKIVPIHGMTFKNPAKIAIPAPAGTLSSRNPRAYSAAISIAINSCPGTYA